MPFFTCKSLDWANNVKENRFQHRVLVWKVFQALKYSVLEQFLCVNKQVNGSVAGTNTAEEKREDQNIKYLSKSKKDRSFAEKERQPS